MRRAVFVARSPAMALPAARMHQTEAEGVRAAKRLGTELRRTGQEKTRPTLLRKKNGERSDFSESR